VAADENIVIVVVLMKGVVRVMVGRAREGVRRRFSLVKIYRAQKTSVKRYVSFFHRSINIHVQPPTVRNIIRCECKFRPLTMIIIIIIIIVKKFTLFPYAAKISSGA